MNERIEKVFVLRRENNGETEKQRREKTVLPLAPRILRNACQRRLKRMPVTDKLLRTIIYFILPELGNPDPT